MPADDYIDQVIHLDRHLVKHPESTFMVIASGDSMVNAGIQSGDMLVVDRKILPAHGNIVVAAVDGELTVKQQLSVKEERLIESAFKNTQGKDVSRKPIRKSSISNHYDSYCHLILSCITL